MKSWIWKLNWWWCCKPSCWKSTWKAECAFAWLISIQAHPSLSHSLPTFCFNENLGEAKKPSPLHLAWAIFLSRHWELMAVVPVRFQRRLPPPFKPWYSTAQQLWFMTANLLSKVILSDGKKCHFHWCVITHVILARAPIWECWPRNDHRQKKGGGLLLSARPSFIMHKNLGCCWRKRKRWMHFFRLDAAFT